MTRQSIAAIEKGAIPSLVVAAKIACVFDKDISDGMATLFRTKIIVSMP